MSLSILKQQAAQLLAHIDAADALFTKMTSSTAPAALAAGLTDSVAVAASRDSHAVPAIGEQWPGQGGIYAGIANGGQGPYHLIVATGPGSDFAAKWGGEGSEVEGATDAWDGLANTRALVNDSTGHPAAKGCTVLTLESHSDFYLPARRELALCFLNVPQLFKKDDWYWSSTQCSRHTAWGQVFGGGGQYGYGKGYEAHVRAVRRFPLQSFSNSVTSDEGGAS